MEDREMMESMIKDVMAKKNSLYVMANSELADQLTEELKKKVDKPLLIKLKGYQMIAVSRAGRRKLLKRLGEMEAEKEKELHEIQLYRRQVWDAL